MDIVTVGIASIPQREAMLEKTVMSIIDQADRIHVCLNGYSHVPEFLNHYRIEVFMSDNSKGDWEKVDVLKGSLGYMLTCDDDLVYPETYVDDMKRMYGSGIMSLHGTRFDRLPITSYYKDISRSKFHCLGRVGKPEQVHTIGTGCAIWHTDNFDHSKANFTLKNAADIVLSYYAMKQGCMLYVGKHDAGYLTYQEPSWTIFDDKQWNDNDLTDFFNKFLVPEIQC